MRKAPFPGGDLRWRGEGRMFLGQIPGFGEKEDEDDGSWREEDEENRGSAHEQGINQEERNLWGFGRKLQVCHWVDPRGSTHDSQNFRKNMKKFQKNSEFWEKNFCSMKSCENDNLELLGPREMMKIELKEILTLIPWN